LGVRWEHPHAHRRRRRRIELGWVERKLQRGIERRVVGQLVGSVELVERVDERVERRLEWILRRRLRVVERGVERRIGLLQRGVERVERRTRAHESPYERRAMLDDAAGGKLSGRELVVERLRRDMRGRQRMHGRHERPLQPGRRRRPLLRVPLRHMHARHRLPDRGGLRVP
jgi:hypothetical protein